MTALGLVLSWAAIAVVGQHAGRVIRLMAYAVGLAFAVLAALHVLVMSYRALTRLEARVSRTYGGCNCSGRARAAGR